MIIQCGFFHHIDHIGCAFNLHSIINNGLIPGGQDSSKRQTVFFFLPIDPEHIDFSVPRRAQHLHSAWPGDGVPKSGAQQAAVDSRGSRTCVCANTFVQGVAHARGEG